MLEISNIKKFQAISDTTNTDNLDTHRISNQDIRERSETMDRTDSYAVPFQSQYNPKVQVTLEFPNQINNNIEKAENDLRNIFKNIQLEKIKNGAFQPNDPALECSQSKFTEVK